MCVYLDIHVYWFICVNVFCMFVTLYKHVYMYISMYGPVHMCMCMIMLVLECTLVLFVF